MGFGRFLGLPFALALGSIAATASPEYLVLVDPGENREFLPAAKAMAALHDARLEEFDPSELDELLARLKQAPPRFVVFVLPPEKIEVDLSHALLSLSTRVDEDLFVDFEYGFITGRDGEAALRFVASIEASWKKIYRRKVACLASWEGAVLPPRQAMSANKALGVEYDQNLILATDPEEKRKQKTRESLESFDDRDALLFFSHGYPDQMVACFSGRDLLDWKIRLPGKLLINCCCYGGAPGRWYEPRPTGFVDRGMVEKADSVALHLLDSGIASYFAGIDPWHGWLANTVYLRIMDDGMRLGEAAKHMADRLALAFAPDRIDFPPTREVKFEGEGTENRRRNGAGMIFYGDPAHAPFEKMASRLGYGELTETDHGLEVTLGVRPLVDGPPGADFLFVICGLTDYYSVKSQDVMNEIQMELYRTFPLPGDVKEAPVFRVKSVLAGKKPLPAGEPQVLIEESPWGRMLHVRVPIEVRPIGSMEVLTVAKAGISIRLVEDRGGH